MNASIGKVELPDRPSMNDTTAGKLAQTQFISSTIKVSTLPHAEYAPNDHREDAPTLV